MFAWMLLGIAAADPGTAAVSHRLDNGLTVVLEPRPSAFVTALVIIGAGSQDEAGGEAEFAHLVEHITFEGRTQHDASGTFSLWEVDGGGFTLDETTAYHYTVPAQALDLTLFHLSERLGFPGDELRDVARIIEGEKGSVIAERLGAESPDDRLREHALVSLVYPRDHRTFPLTGADMRVVADATADAVLRWRDAFYTPANTTLVLVGGFDADAALATVQRWFAPWVDPGPIQRAPADVPERGSPTPWVRVDPDLETPVVLSGWPVPPPSHPDSRALRVATSIARGRVSWAVTGGLVVLADELPDGRDPRLVVEGQARRFEELEPTAANVDFWRRVFTQVGSRWTGSLEERARVLGDCQVRFADPNCAAAEQAALDAVTPDDVREVVARWLTPERRTTVVLVSDPSRVSSLGGAEAPFEPGPPVERPPVRPAGPDHPDRVPPVVTDPESTPLPDATPLALGEGRSGWLVRAPGPEVEVTIGVHRGDPMALRAMVAALSTDEDADTEVSATIDSSRAVVNGVGEGLAAVRDTAAKLRRSRVPRDLRDDDTLAWVREPWWRESEPGAGAAKQRLAGLLDGAFVSVVVRGDLDTDDVERELLAGLGRLGGGAPIDGPVELRRLGASTLRCVDAPEQPFARWTVYTGAPGFGEPDEEAMRVLDWVLGGQYHSRFKSDFRLGRQLSYYQGSDYYPWQRLWSFEIDVPLQDAVEALGLIDGHLAAAAESGLTAGELHHAWVARTLAWNRGIEDADAVAYQRLWRTPQPPAPVAAADVARVAREWLGGPRLAVVEGPRDALGALPAECWTD